jgi:hypothetical protein
MTGVAPSSHTYTPKQTIPMPVNSWSILAFVSTDALNGLVGIVDLSHIDLPLSKISKVMCGLMKAWSVTSAHGYVHKTIPSTSLHVKAEYLCSYFAVTVSGSSPIPNKDHGVATSVHQYQLSWQQRRIRRRPPFRCRRSQVTPHS